MRHRGRLWPLLVLVVAIAAIAFVLSFDALRTLGVACGINASLAWMFPLIIDLPVIAFTWATWVFRTRGLGQAYPWAMLVLFSLVSLTGNALHAHPVAVDGLTLPQWAASLLMTMPAVALLATSHMIVKSASKSLDDEESEPESVGPIPEPEPEPVEPEPEPVEPEPKPVEPEPKPVEPEPEPESAGRPVESESLTDVWQRLVTEQRETPAA